MRNIGLIKDIKIAVNIFRDVRKARRIERENTRVEIPAAGSFHDTVEGCTLANCEKEIHKIAMRTFAELPYDEKEKLIPMPRDGEFIDRANAWKELLSPVMTEKQLRKAMIRIIHWYIHIKHLKREENSYAA